MTTSDHDLEVAMGQMLRIGVTIAALVVLAGGVLYLWQNQGPVPDYKHFHGAATEYTQIGGILRGAIRLDSRSLIEFGLLLLIATPIGRVIFGVAGFAKMKDWLYAVVSVIVLAVLLFSLFWKR
ncbi:MAG TPA: DUF1634 domain-containing protein [Terracidiphilus sp.]|nr:DUF1634 domain-containing protein [Terracidiphilus sp.]